MTNRQSALLKNIIEGYVATAQPIGSNFLATKGSLKVSPATIRNELAVLEEEGYISQPHTSAGRIPTIQGIEHYLAHLLEVPHLSEELSRRLVALVAEDGIRGLAKEVAAHTQAAVILAQRPHDYYYTGLSHLFSQPEFHDYHIVQAISEAVDKIDAVLPQFISDNPGSNPKVYIGTANPLGEACAALFVGNQKDTVFGLLTPVRTDYAKNISYLTVVASLI